MVTTQLDDNMWKKVDALCQKRKDNEDSITKKLVYYRGSKGSKNAAGLYESLSNLEFIIDENWTGDDYVSDNMKDIKYDPDSEYNKKMAVSGYV